jgi:hypothetical protein
MRDSISRRFFAMTRNLDPETRAIVCDLVRRMVPLEEIIRLIGLLPVR